MNFNRLLISSTVVLAFLPMFALAAPAASFSYDLLAPIGTGGLTVTTITGGLGQYLNLIFRVAIALTGLLAVVMIVICGIKLMTAEAISSKSEAKQCITNAILGIIIAIGSFIILNTINPLLLNNNVDFGSATDSVRQGSAAGTGGPVTEGKPTAPGWTFQYKDGLDTRYLPPVVSLSECIQRASQFAQQGKGIISTPSGACMEITRDLGYTNLAEDAARSAFCGNTLCLWYGSSATNPSINNPPCTPIRDKNCTNLAGMPSATINYIKNTLVTDCGGCKIVLTGGTEPGHSSAGNASHFISGGSPINYGVFDLRLDPRDALYNLITTKGTDGKVNPATGVEGPGGIRSCDNVTNSSFCRNKRYLYKGYWFIDEISAATRHWHVCLNGLNVPYCKPLP